MIRVCSGFSPSGYEQYGKRFLDLFHRYWPADIDLVVYGEKPVPMPRGRFYELKMIPGVTEFIARHKDNPDANGKTPRKGWREREKAKGYCFKFDAVKFCRQCFIPEAAAAGMDDGDILVWLDADVMTLTSFPESFIEGMLKGGDLCFLGRTGAHSEIGFWAVRLNPETRAFLTDFADVFRNDKVFDLTEWHSAFVFDHCRQNSLAKQVDLTPGGRGHVWFQSPLGKHLDHLKGDDRKRLGFSNESRRSR
jgi:hypothetical protein